MSDLTRGQKAIFTTLFIYLFTYPFSLFLLPTLATGAAITAVVLLTIGWIASLILSIAFVVNWMGWT